MTPWSLIDHGIDTADEGGRHVWRFRADQYGVVAYPLSPPELPTSSIAEPEDPPSNMSCDELESQATVVLASGVVVLAGLLSLAAGGLVLAWRFITSAT